MCASGEKREDILERLYGTGNMTLSTLFLYILFIQGFSFFSPVKFFILIHFRSRDLSHIWNGWNFFSEPSPLSATDVCKWRKQSIIKKRRIRLFFFPRFRQEREPSGNDFFLSLTGFRYFLDLYQEVQSLKVIVFYLGTVLRGKVRRFLYVCRKEPVSRAREVCLEWNEIY